MYKKTLLTIGMLVALFGAVFAFAQSTVHISIAPAVSGAHFSAEFQRILGEIDSTKLVPVVSGSWEEEVLVAAEKSADATLHLNLVGTNPAGLYTLTTDQGDVLVAKWDRSDPDRQETAICCGIVHRPRPFF